MANEVLSLVPSVLGFLLFSCLLCGERFTLGLIFSGAAALCLFLWPQLTFALTATYGASWLILRAGNALVLPRERVLTLDELVAHRRDLCCEAVAIVVRHQQELSQVEARISRLEQFVSITGACSDELATLRAERTRLPALIAEAEKSAEHARARYKDAVAKAYAQRQAEETRRLAAISARIALG